MGRLDSGASRSRHTLAAHARIKGFSRLTQGLVGVDYSRPCTLLIVNHPVIVGTPHILRVAEIVNTFALIQEEKSAGGGI